MADLQGTSIYELPAQSKATIVDQTNAWFPYEDRSADPVDTFRMTIDDLLSNLTLPPVEPEYVVYSPSHGLTSGAIGKPVGWRADGKPYVWTDTATTEIPVAIVAAITDTNHVQITPIGPLAEIANTLLPGSIPVYSANSNSRLLCWDASAAAYKHITQGDASLDLRVIYWIGLKEGDATTSVCMVMPPGVNASPRTVVANVRDFGAMQDGSTDDRTAIQAAIDSNRPIVYFPGSPSSAVYLISDYILLNNDYQQLLGDGPSSILHCDHEDSCAIWAYGTSATDRLVGCQITKLWIQGAAATVGSPTEPTGSANGNGIRVYYCHQFTLSDCLISHCTGNGVHMYKCGSVLIRDNWFFNQYYAEGWIQNAEVYSNDENQSITVRGNHFHSNIRLHVYLAGSENEYREVTHNVSFACTSEGVILSPQHSETTNSSDAFSIVKHNIALCYGTDVNTGYAGRCIVADNLCWAGRWSNLYYNSDTSAQDDIGMRLVVSGNIFMAGAWFNNESYASPSLSAAVSIWAGREVLVHGNLILDAKCHPLARSAIRINMVQDQGFAVITDNVISNAFAGGIYMDGAVARHVVRGNYLANCGGRDYHPIFVYTTNAIGADKTVSSINTGTDVFSATAHGFSDGDRIRFTTTGTFFTAAGVVVDSLKLFYVRDKTTDTFKIAETPTGDALDITATFVTSLTAKHAQYEGGNVVADNVIVNDINQKISDSIEFAASAVNASTNRITLTNHGITGAATQKIVFDNATPANLFAINSSTVLNSTVYYGRYVDANTFEVSETYSGAAADITDAGTGTHSFRMISEAEYGIYYRNDSEVEPSVIRDNVVISHQPQAAGYGSVGYGILYYGTGPKVISDNLISGFLVGIRLASSHTARAVEEIQIAENYLRNCYYGFWISGSVNGLVLVDDTNHFTGSGGHRVYQESAYAGIQGSRRAGKVVANHPYRASKTLTITNGVQDISCTSHGYSNGDRVQLSGTIPTPFSAATNYWIVGKTASTLKLSATRGGSAITPTAGGSCTMTHQVPGFGTWVAGDKLVNESWDSADDVDDWVCTTAGAIGTCVFTPRRAVVQTTTAYAASNVTTDRTYDADTVAVAELADIVGTLLADLKSAGVLP